MMGAGVKGGSSYGATDQFGRRAEVNPTTVWDFYATVLHLPARLPQGLEPQLEHSEFNRVVERHSPPIAVDRYTRASALSIVATIERPFPLNTGRASAIGMTIQQSWKGEKDERNYVAQDVPGPYRKNGSWRRNGWLAHRSCHSTRGRQ
jgi:hypothetical protein